MEFDTARMEDAVHYLVLSETRIAVKDENGSFRSVKLPDRFYVGEGGVFFYEDREAGAHRCLGNLADVQLTHSRDKARRAAAELIRPNVDEGLAEEPTCSGEGVECRVVEEENAVLSLRGQRAAAARRNREFEHLCASIKHNGYRSIAGGKQ